MSQSTRLTLICHGATAAMKSAGFAADEPLLVEALKAAERVKQVLPYAHSFVSAPERRTRQSAEALTAEFEIDPAVRDIDYGRWAGKSLATIEAEESENLVAWLSKVDAAPHGGESIAALMLRASGWLASHFSTGGHTVVVTHPSVIRAVIVTALDAPPESFWKIDVRPWSSTEITSDGRRWALRSFGQLFV